MLIKGEWKKGKELADVGERLLNAVMTRQVFHSCVMIFYKLITDVIDHRCKAHLVSLDLLTIDKNSKCFFILTEMHGRLLYRTGNHFCSFFKTKFDVINNW